MTLDLNDYTDPNLLETVFHDREALSKQLAAVKTETSKELVEEHERKLDRFLNLLTKVDAAYARKIDEHRNARRMLKVLSDTLKTDKAETRSYMFELIGQRRESRYRSGSEG